MSLSFLRNTHSIQYRRKGERNANIVSFHTGTTRPAETEKDLAVCTQFLLIVECEQGFSSRPLIQAECQDPGWP